MLEPAEIDQISSAIRDPSFPEMFRDYVEEVSSQESRNESIQYVLAMAGDRQLPAGKCILEPTPCFCVQSHIIGNARARLLLNITRSEYIDDGLFDPKKSRIPLLVGPPRYEKDGDATCIVVDAVIGTKSGDQALRRGSGLRFAICELVIDELNRRNDFRHNLISKDVKLRTEWAYKDSARVMPMVVDDRSIGGVSPSVFAPALESEPALERLSDSALTRSETATFSVVEATNVEGSGFEESGSGTRTIKVTVTLPGVTSAPEIDVQVFGKSLAVSALDHSLCIALPCSVCSEPHHAQFDKTSSVLTLGFIPN